MANKTNVKDIIKELQKDIEKNPNVLEDEEFNPDASPRVSSKIINEEVSVIDELLASVPKGQGYYLKLYKEIRPNQHEFKLKIDSFETWSDLELEIANIVRDYTLKDITKWGSGTYRIIVHRKEGIRGPKYNPIDFYIDAQEMPGIKNGTTAINPLNDLSSITNIIKTIREVNPTITPAEMQKTMAESYQAGLKSQTEKENNNNNTIAVMMTSLTSMMTAVLSKPEIPKSDIIGDLIKSLPVLLSTLKELDFIKTAKQEKSITDTVKELQDLGLFKPAKEIDPMKKLMEMKELITTVQSLSSFTQGERPSLIEKLIDSLAPQIPNFIDKISSSVDKVSELIKMQQNPQPIASLPPSSTPTSIPTTGGNGTTMNTQFFDELYNLIINQDFTHHETILTAMNKLNNNVDITPDILSDKLNVNNLTQVLRLYGGTKFNDESILPKMVTFVTNFITYIKNKVVSSTSIQPLPYIVKCQSCNEEYEFAVKEDFDTLSNEDKVCEDCKGKLIGV